MYALWLRNLISEVLTLGNKICTSYFFFLFGGIEAWSMVT